MLPQPPQFHPTPGPWVAQIRVEPNHPGLRQAWQLPVIGWWSADTRDELPDGTAGRRLQEVEPWVWFENRAWGLTSVQHELIRRVGRSNRYGASWKLTTELVPA